MNKQTKTAPQFAIVVIAYNRLESIKRLVISLLKANYSNDKIDLVISIDNSGSNKISDYAKSLTWPHGELKVIIQNERLGLKKHVLKCGNLTEIYDNICVLEDDLYVSPSFYLFAKAATTHFKNIDKIAGISLYSHQWNPYANRQFSSIEDRYDVFLLQVASSWGQVWDRKGWNDFMQWIEDKTDNDLHSDFLPREVSNWSEKSWLKFHNKYLVDTKKYFVYPRQSLTTNFSDRGEHATVTTTYQVPLLLDIKEKYEFPLDINSLMQYDAFFENERIFSFLEIKNADLDVNTYGLKLSKKRYLITTEILNFKIIRTFGLKTRPIDSNILLEIPGEEIFLYDTTESKINSINHNQAHVQKFLYDTKSEAKKDFLRSSIYLYYKAILRKLRLV